MIPHSDSERIDTVIVGGGEAGLAVGYHLAQRGREFLIVDASRRIGEAWRQRWESLRLFTPAALDALPGLPSRRRVASSLQGRNGRLSGALR